MWVRKILTFIAFAVLVVFSLKTVAFAEDPTPTPTPTPTSAPTSAPDNSQRVSDLQKQINEYQSKISDLQSQGKTLSSQIGVMDGQIKLTELRIAEAEEQIKDLERDIEIAKGKVSSLQKDINVSTKALMGRITAVYQVGSMKPWEVFLTANNLHDVFTRLTYLRVVQASDKRKVYAAEQAKNDYENQKSIYEDKEAEAQALSKKLSDYTSQLDKQKKDKQALLTETRGSEANYQKLLAQARAEFQAIQGIVAGKGTESEVGKVSEGQQIASIIPSSSCNSTGPHLHFIVKDGGSTQNPFNYLKPVDYSNDSGGDPFNPSGSWEWPIAAPIQFNQGFGADTWYVRTYHRYPFHDGIDINSSSHAVKAVKSGTLFRGSYSVGCALPYMRLKHEDGKETFYLHVISY